MIRPLITLLLILIPSLGFSQLYHPGEELDYKVSYRARFFPNTEVATVTVRTDLNQYQDRAVYRVVGHGKTMPTYRLFFSLDDTYTIHIDTASLKTLHFNSDLKEGDYTFKSDYCYDWERMEVATWWQSRKREPKRDTIALTNESMDAISLFFNMRSEEAENFKEGEQRTLQLVLEDTIRYLNYRFVGREVKKIRQMGKFKTLKFACQIGTSEGYSFTDGDEFYIWISDDKNKVPLWLESPIKIGSIQAYVTRLKGLKYPLDSRVK